MNKDEFDKIIRLLQNPTRRKIIEILTREEHYPLQISRTLNASQQAISKHLTKLEEEGIVVSNKGKSEHGGPPTKNYRLNSEFSLRIDVGPTLFKTEVDDIEVGKISGYEHLEEKVKQNATKGLLERNRKVIQEIEKEVKDLEKKRKYLLKLKEKALSDAYNYIYENFDDYQERYVLYYILDSGITNPKKISKKFRVREDDIENLINELKKKTKIW
ncbi:MAG: ArsR/SmtB family transcription factor [Thermoplasmatota archaeon]